MYVKKAAIYSKNSPEEKCERVRCHGHGSLADGERLKNTTRISNTSTRTEQVPIRLHEFEISSKIRKTSTSSENKVPKCSGGKKQSSACDTAKTRRVTLLDKVEVYEIFQKASTQPSPEKKKSVSPEEKKKHENGQSIAEAASRKKSVTFEHQAVVIDGENPTKVLSLTP
ncbi:unnamed protein product, partial [Nesidiocoris tenuis]